MLVIRKSDSRIFAFGASCSIVATGISTENQAIPFVAIAANGVTPTAADFEVVNTNLNPVGHFHGGFSHEWTGTAVQSVAGYNPPAAPATSIWDNARPMAPDRFTAYVASILGVKYDAMKNDPRTSFVIDTILAPTQEEIDPNDKGGNFKKMVAYLRGQIAWGATPQLQSPDDDNVIMTSAEETALAANWNGVT